MTKTSPVPQASLPRTKMLFLVSHGLQTPLSAIRWGCGRLKRSAKNLSTDDAKILENVQQEARTLSEMFDRLLLLAKVEERIHIPNIQEVFVQDFLQAKERTEHLPRDIQLSVTCPADLMLRVDRTVFSSILDGLLLAIAVSSDKRTIPVLVRQEGGDMCVVTLEAPLALSFIEEAVPGKADEKLPRIVGGVAGFLLAVSSSLANALGGAVTADGSEETVQSIIFSVPLSPVLEPLA